ncbi:MAG: ABC transporter permease [Gracilimonas sp.]|uniref:ABC transporter permease n=1 Tax=Gracilimonas sp. TaxID=1974203 RepID=UPI001B2488D5|nr:FtsX-like permease family protein [Gracilimonas sp.]MBO6585346.1 ABC transporter permease [Gracilimonas sp.]MBO6616342.1 ABC transporter permease [Gracilimonas sp.]
MFKNYLKISVRNLLNKKGYSLINILGLAIGLATSLLIVLYVLNEWSYDKFHSNSDRIYRVVQTMTSEDRVEEQATTPFRLGPVLDAEFPDHIEKTVRFFDMQEENHTFLNREDQVSFRESNFYFVDSTFFDVFSAELIQGNPSEALKNPLSLVISEDLASKYFGDENPIGQSLSYKGIRDMTVTGVMKSWPEQSHMKIDLVASFTSLNEIYASSPGYDRSWLWNPIWTYILAKDGADTGFLNSQLATLKDKYYRAYSGWPKDESVDIELQPITDIHLTSNRDQEMEVNSSITYIYILLVVAGFILLFACINFMNLSTARSMERSREVGMRKVLGGHKQQLFYQFIGESFLVTLIAIILGIIIMIIALPFFNELTAKSITFNPFDNFYTIPGLILLTAFVGLIAGLYPALYLSSFEPVDVLKGNSTRGKKTTIFRKTLVTFQFTLSVILIIGTSIVYLQLDFIQEKDLGFDKNFVVMLPTKQNLIAWEFENFKEQSLNHAQIQSVTGLGKIPGSEHTEYYRYVPAGNGDSQDGLNLVLHVTHDVTETFDLEIIAGRSFSRDFSTDAEKSVLINRKMLTQLDAETPEQALGETIYHYPPSGDREAFTIIGVLEDFNYTSLKKEIEPLILRLVEGTRPILGYIEHTAVEIAPGDVTGALEHLEKSWKEVNPIDPFEYRFLDERLAEIYETETTMSSLSTSFSILCILIACLGLLGLASYSAQLRKQEIGIRKSLGASVADIVGLLSKDFLILVGIANIIAWPVSYYLGSKWLENFTYRFDFLASLPLLFLGSGLLIVIIALGTVGYHSVKAALINPVNAIRSE